MKIQITARFTGSVLFEHEAENNTMKLTLEAAISAGANLAGAYLYGTNLDGTNLDGANTTQNLTPLADGLRAKGHTVSTSAQSSGTSTIMRAQKNGASVLEGGVQAWQGADLPLVKGRA